MVEITPKLQAEIDRTKPSVAMMERDDPDRRAFIDIVYNYMGSTPALRESGNLNRTVSDGIYQSDLVTLPVITESTVRDYAKVNKLEPADAYRLADIFNDVAKGEYIDFGGNRETGRPLRAAQEQFYKDINATKELIGIRSSSPEGRYTTLSSITADLDYLQTEALKAKTQHPNESRIGDLLEPSAKRNLTEEARNLTPDQFIERLKGARQGITTEYEKTEAKVNDIRANAPATVPAVATRTVEKGSFNQVIADAVEMLNTIMQGAGKVISSALGR